MAHTCHQVWKPEFRSWTHIVEAENCCMLTFLRVCFSKWRTIGWEVCSLLDTEFDTAAASHTAHTQSQSPLSSLDWGLDVCVMCGVYVCVLCYMGVCGRMYMCVCMCVSVCVSVCGAEFGSTFSRMHLGHVKWQQGPNFMKDKGGEPLKFPPRRNSAKPTA